MCVKRVRERSSEVEVPPEGVCLNLPTLPTLPIDLELPRPAGIENLSLSSSPLPWWLEDDDDGDLRCCILPMTHE